MKNETKTIMKTRALLLFAAFFFAGLFRLASASPFTDGMSAYYQKQWPAAEADFRKALQTDPNNSLALVYYIVSSYWDGNFDHEMRGLEDSLVDDPDDQRAQIWLAYFHYTEAFTQGQDPQQALGELRQAARLGRSPVVYTGIGIIYYDIGSLTRAQKELARAMDMNPKDVLAYEYMGRILLSFAGDPKDSLGYFRQEVSLAPAYPDGHYYLGRALAELGEANSAIAQYQKAIELDPLGVGRGSDALIAQGDLYEKTGQFDLAERAYRQALSQDPDNAALKQRLEQVEKNKTVK